MIFNLTTEELSKKQSIATASEIAQQPLLWKKILSLILNQELIINNFFNKINNLENVKFIFTGSGTSEFAGKVVSSHFQLRNNNFIAIAATDIVSNPSNYFKADDNIVLISFARSGNSPESVASINLVKNIVNNFFQIIITCNETGILYQQFKNDLHSLVLLLPSETNDLSFAMTSSFTSMVITALIVFEIYFDNVKNIVKEINYISEEINPWIKEKYSLIMSLINNYNRAIILGSNGLMGYAQEGALKLLELTAGLVNGNFNSSLGLRHGPKSMINNKTVAIILLSNNSYTRNYDIDIIKELISNNKAQRIIILDNFYDNKIASICQNYFAFNHNDNNISDVSLGLEYIVWLQMFAMFTAWHYKITPDNPCPTGEVNRVVQGVTIYDYHK